MSFYDFENDTVFEKVFQGVNQRPLGDVLQSVNIQGDKAYLILNNSGTIEVVDKNSFELEGTISGFTSPRYIQITSSSKAYVTDLYADKIAIVDLNAKSITGYIDCVGWTEEMVQIDDLVYVVNLEDHTIYIINHESDEIIDTFQFDFTINSLKKDNQDRLWVCGNEDGLGRAIRPEWLETRNMHSSEKVFPSPVIFRIELYVLIHRQKRNCILMLSKEKTQQIYL